MSSELVLMIFLLIAAGVGVFFVGHYIGCGCGCRVEKNDE